MNKAYLDIETRLTDAQHAGRMAHIAAVLHAEGIDPANVIIISDRPEQFRDTVTFAVQERLKEKAVNQKKAMAVFAAAAAALFPTGLGNVRVKKPKRAYGKCLCCGNPCRDSVCKKCQNGPTVELK